MTFLRTLGAIVTASALSLSTPVFGQVDLRISTAAPGVAPLTGALERISSRVNEAFLGAINMSVHHSGSLFRQGTEVPALMRGQLEMSTPVIPEFVEHLPQWGALGGAYMYRDADHMLATLNGEIGTEFFQEVEDSMGIVVLAVGYLGTRTVNLRDDREVRVPSDLAGVKMRMPPGGAFSVIARALGAQPVSMPITEVYLALQTGSIDAQDNPTNMTRDWRFSEVTSQVILTRHLVQPVFVAISRQALDRLSPEQQETLRAIVSEEVAAQVAASMQDEGSALEDFIAGGLTVVEPDMEAFRAAVFAEYEASGEMQTWTPGLADRIAAVE